MSVLKKLSDCLGYLLRSDTRSPGISNVIAPVADPEVSFGWQGNLFANAELTGVNAAGTAVTSVSIVEDCFYAGDASWFVLENGAATRVRLRYQILDPAGQIAWELIFGSDTATLVGVIPWYPVPTMRLHLISGMKVQWVLLDAMAISDRVGASIALRKLYQDQL